ncbi:MAG: hypothetical protein M0000_13650 [Actinomycetota bacterium]|nr:hypothetical protein [Actinomycetota bacterium]
MLPSPARLRETAGVSVEELAQALGTTETQVAHFGHVDSATVMELRDYVVALGMGLEITVLHNGERIIIFRGASDTTRAQPESYEASWERSA